MALASGTCGLQGARGMEPVGATKRVRCCVRSECKFRPQPHLHAGVGSTLSLPLIMRRGMRQVSACAGPLDAGHPHGESWDAPRTNPVIW